ELLRLPHGSRRIEALGKTGGDGSGENASTAVRVDRAHSHAWQLDHVGPVPKNVGYVITRVTALDHCGARPELHQLAGGRLSLVESLDSATEDHLRLGQVWSDDRGERQKARTQDLDRVVAQQ